LSVTTVGPSTGTPLATYEGTTADQVDATLRSAHDAAALWRGTPLIERARALRRFGAALRDRRDELAPLATREMGKPLADSHAEIDKCAGGCEWFADHGPAILRRDAIETEAVSTFVEYLPLGVLFAIMPWNFPHWRVIWALAPAFAAGNVVVLKHAPSTTGCALALRDVARDAELPAGVFSVLVASVESTPRPERASDRR
jgi:succinate-semialdehyde dehydrogenase/glutarate-semialdehyde dehydrogenase